MNSFDEKLWNDESVNANSYDESYDESGYDESYDESSYDDGGDAAEFLPLLSTIGSAAGVGGIINGIRNIVSRPATRPIRQPGGPTPGGMPSGNYAVNPHSTLTAQVPTSTGNRPLVLPPEIATKDDLQKVANSVGADIRKLAHTVRQNAARNTAAMSQVNTNLGNLEKKNNAIEARQTEVLRIVNRRVNKLKAEQDAMKQQSMMMMMFTLLSPPELKSITAAGQKVDITASEFDNGNSMLPLVLMMGFGSSSDSSGSNNMMNNPLMLLALTGAFK